MLLKTVTSIALWITILINLFLAGLLFLPAVMAFAVQSPEAETMGLLEFAFSPLGAQTMAHLAATLALFFAIHLLPDDWWPASAKAIGSMPLLVTALLCMVTAVIIAIAASMPIALVAILNLVAGAICARWAIGSQRPA